MKYNKNITVDCNPTESIPFTSFFMNGETTNYPISGSTNINNRFYNEYQVKNSTGGYLLGNFTPGFGNNFSNSKTNISNINNNNNGGYQATMNNGNTSFTPTSNYSNGSLNTPVNLVNKLCPKITPNGCSQQILNQMLQNSPTSFSNITDAFSTSRSASPFKYPCSASAISSAPSSGTTTPLGALGIDLNAFSSTSGFLSSGGSSNNSIRSNQNTPPLSPLNIITTNLDSNNIKKRKIIAEKKNPTSSDKSTGGKNKEFTCNICTKLFRYKQHLNTHIKTVHKKIKDFKCPTCDKTFGEKSALKKHVLTVHKKIRPFKCPKCNRSFGQKAHLTKHVLSKNSCHYDLKNRSNTTNNRKV